MKLAIDKAWLRVPLHTGYTQSHVAGFTFDIVADLI